MRGARMGVSLGHYQLIPGMGLGNLVPSSDRLWQRGHCVGMLLGTYRELQAHRTGAYLSTLVVNSSLARTRWMHSSPPVRACVFRPFDMQLY